MPFGGLVWVDRQPLHTLVFADEALFRDGQLNRDGHMQIDAALAAVGAPSLEGAQFCVRPPLWAIAG